jgi:hypothetical protein
MSIIVRNIDAPRTLMRTGMHPSGSPGLAALPPRDPVAGGMNRRVPVRPPLLGTHMTAYEHFCTDWYIAQPGPPANTSRIERTFVPGPIPECRHEQGGQGVHR